MEKNRLIKVYSQGVIDDEELEVQLVDLRTRIENLKMLIAAVDADLARETEAQQVAASTEAWLMTLRENLEEVEQDTEEGWRARREIVALLVDKITVGRNEEGRTTVSVTYRFALTEVEHSTETMHNSSEFRQPWS
jgi:signal recognition particle receptor subunit beta